jgi:hypothetical protein
MSDDAKPATEDRIVTEVIGSQLEHFRHIDPPCRGLELPDGILLRHIVSKSLYFYLRTVVEDGKISTLVFASDSPYDHQKAGIGSVSTPMFEHRADQVHLEKLEKLIREWIEFVREDPNTWRDFQSFNVSS